MEGALVDWIDAHPIAVLVALAVVIAIVLVPLAVAWREFGKGGKKGDWR